AIERRRLPVADALAEFDELPVLDDGDGLARELASSHPLDRRLERLEIVEQWPVALAQRVGVRGGGSAERAQAIADHAEVLGLVAGLARERHLHVYIVRDHQPARRDLGGFDLVLERNLQEIDDVELAVDLGLQGVVRRQTIEESPILGVEGGDEFFGGHEATPPRSSVGSSAVSVSFVTTRVQRVCHGCVSRASACVVKARTGTPTRSAAAKMRA